MKKQEVKIVKAAVQRSAKLDQGMKVELGLTDKKEQQRLNKTFKPFTADPIVKKAVKGKTFAQWVGRIELLDGEQLSVLQIDRFGKRTVYLLPSDETGELTTMPESTFTPEQVKELLHMANVCSADERDKLLFKAETVAAPAENWEELLATCGEADRRFLDKVLDMLAKEIAYKLPKILRKSLDTAAVMMAAIDEQLHTMRKDSLRWTQESETVFTLGPAEGAADVITLPLNGEPVPLAVHELETVAQMVRICLTPQVRTQFFREVAEVLNAIKASDGEGERLVKSCTEAEQWRLCLVYMLPNDALGARQAKETIAWLNSLDGVFWKSTAAVE